MENHFNILFIGDVVGRPGIDCVKNNLQFLVDKYQSDFVILNAENSCNGKGITEDEATIFYELGVNVLTTGNHVWENWRSKVLLASNADIVRPLNYPPGNPGKGFLYYDYSDDLCIGILQLQGRTFMQSIDCPFRAAEFGVKALSERTKLIIVDFHADATAEKMAMAWHLDGKVSALIGTHTHIQTSDARILPKGTAYITDVGMTGPYDSVVGMKKEVAIKRLTLQTPHKFELAEDDNRIAGVSISIDLKTNKAVKIESFIYPEFLNSKI